jgi:hypothetical protein
MHHACHLLMCDLCYGENILTFEPSFLGAFVPTVPNKCLVAAFQSLTNSTQFPADHQRLPDITFIDLNPTCSYLEESPYKPFPANCCKSFDNNLGKMEPPHIYLCMSAKVFYSLDISDGMMDEQRATCYSACKNMVFLASMPGTCLQRVMWVLVSEPASIQKLGSGIVHFNALSLGVSTSMSLILLCTEQDLLPTGVSSQPLSLRSMMPRNLRITI